MRIKKKTMYAGIGGMTILVIVLLIVGFSSLGDPEDFSEPVKKVSKSSGSNIQSNTSYNNIAQLANQVVTVVPVIIIVIMMGVFILIVVSVVLNGFRTWD